VEFCPDKMCNGFVASPGVLLATLRPLTAPLSLLSLVLESTHGTRSALRASLWFADDLGWIEL